jgi:dTDP-4-dehydrorhamnose reductase
MKTLIIGARGSLGTQLVKIFNDGRELERWDYPELDFLNFPDLLINLNRFRPELIINAAAYNAVDQAESDEGEYALALKLNGDLPSVLGKWCLENSAQLISYSSDYVFSGTAAQPFFIESDQTNPINRYGDSKRLGEEAIRSLEKDGLFYYLIRVSKLFGPAGVSPHSKKSFFDIMQVLAQTKKELTVVDEESSCFTYTPDLARATYDLVAAVAPTGIYHLVNEGAATWYEAVLILSRLAGWHDIKITPISGQDLNRPAKRPAYSILKNTKRPQLRPYQEALREFINQSN